MNVDAAKNVQSTQQTSKVQTQSTKNGDIKFADELKNVENNKKVDEKDLQDKKTEDKAKISGSEDKKTEDKAKNSGSQDDKTEDKAKNSGSQDDKKENKNVNKAIDGLNDTLKELDELNRSEESLEQKLKLEDLSTDINGMLDNDMNIRERELLSSQMNASMNFNGNGQSFSDFMNNQNKNEELAMSAKDIAEEKAVMSTMAENYMMAKAKSNENSIHLNKNNTGMQGENIESVVMTRSDVDFFASLVNKQELNVNELTDVQKASQVSKTLADMLANSMKNNKPLRIDFDNNISVIIKISRDGKISADFLPSSQIAEAYLRENLPILRQKFDDNNIDYNELNQRKQRQEQDKDNRKKGSKDE